MSRRSPDRSAAITGIGVVSPIGADADALWHAILAGRSGVSTIQAFDTSAFRTHVGCEIPDAWLAARAPDALPRATRLALVAAGEALARACVAADECDAICLGTTMGNLPEIERHGAAARPETWRAVLEEPVGNSLARALDFRGPVWTIGTSCSAGNVAVARALDLIRSGAARRVLAGGVDALSKMAFIGFSRLRAMAAGSCRPFSRDRDGLLLGEGAALVVLERGDDAAARGRAPLALLAGYGLSCDAHHVASPCPDGRGAFEAMEDALRDADEDARGVDYVCAHGTGTPQNDEAEASAARRLFGEEGPHVSSLKALTGHTLGAASALELVACVQSLRHQRVIPAWGWREPDPRCPIRPAPRDGQIDRELRVVMNNGFAFGGNNSCLVLRRA